MLGKLDQIHRARALIARHVNADFFGEIRFRLLHGNIVEASVLEHVKVETPEEAHAVMARTLADPPSQLRGIMYAEGRSPVVEVVVRGRLHDVQPVPEKP